MKRIACIISIIFFTCAQAYAWDKNEARDNITNAQQQLNLVDNNIELKNFIPFGIYNDAVINLLNSRNSYNNRDYNSSYFYSSTSMVKLDTALLLAHARKIRSDMLQYERTYYKKKFDDTRGDVNVQALKSIISAGLNMKGRLFIATLTDSDLFKKGLLKLSKNGMQRLDAIAQVLTQYPEATLTIVGHTRSPDYKNYSQTKAGVSARYIIQKGISSKRIIVKGLGNKEVMDTPLGYRRISRTEFLISGTGI